MKKICTSFIACVAVLSMSCNKETLTTPVAAATSSALTSQHYVGESFGGGIIFYVTKNGRHGLIAATQDLEEPASWSKKDTITNATGTTIGKGYANTNRIYKALGFPLYEPDNYAAFECIGFNLNGYQDWFLPSRDELNELYKQQTVVGNFKPFTYWSSSENDVSTAWLQNFSTGVQSTQIKFASYSIRPVRQF